jgi:TRAP-type mannitol/chloroaromatic compound transport system permease large subunit
MVAGVTPHKMIEAIVFVFVIAILGAAFTPALQTQVDSWAENLTTAGQTAAASVVTLIPLLFWILLAVGMILVIVATFLPGKLGGL